MIRPDSLRRMRHLPYWIGALAFSAMAVFFLWAEHRAHLLGALPWLLLLACPLLHLGMHGGQSHRGHESRQSANDDYREERPS